MKTQQKYIRNIGLGILFTAFITACDSQHSEKTVDGKPIQKQSLIPKAEKIHYLNPEYSLSLPGELAPYEEVELYAKINGFLEKIYVERGDIVRKGQLLAELVAPEVDQKYLSDQSTQSKMESDYLFLAQAYERLLDASNTNGAVAQLELDRAKSLMMSAKSAFESSQAGTAQSSQLRQYLKITAPFDGVITQRNLSLGALVGPGNQTSLFTIAQTDKLRLIVAIPEKHASAVSKELKADFKVSSLPGKSFEAKLSRSSGMLSQQTRAITLEFDVENKDDVLKGGEYAQVNLNLHRGDSSFWVAPNSIVNAQSGTFIMTLNNNTLKRVSVGEGVRLDSLIEVFGELDQRDSVLIRPSEELKEGELTAFN
ncbi:efflux RND transporter periplasmic adaptor subunit [Algoriphagus sp.]|uniref:efflux RND transporter periplasmic adaptor subunit n=1 Tax=Algoriphagus sp. TaxID=1872435 RepID=UPI003F70BE00